MAVLTTLNVNERGIDTNNRVNSTTEAQNLAAATNATFIGRYISRTAALNSASPNLTQTEVTNILDAGLKLLVVQRPPGTSSEYTIANATAWGTYAADAAAALTLPSGTRIFCDVEGVAASFDTVSWVKEWVRALKARAQTQYNTLFIGGLYYGTSIPATQVQTLVNGGYTTAAWAAFSSSVPKNIGESIDQGPGNQTVVVGGQTFPVDYNTVIKSVSGIPSRT